MNAFAVLPDSTVARAGPMRARVCAVALTDRRTGAAHRIAGRPLVIFTRDPAAAAAQLLQGRDPAVWRVDIRPLEQEGQR